jgi:glycosyltransferase involved in cell wall biosynthesis
VLARTKIFVSLQRYENYPSQSLLEAMASGCAVIATDVGDTRLLLDESCALLIPRDADALAAAIRSLLDDGPRRAALGEAARARVLKDHTVERFAVYFKELVR